MILPSIDIQDGRAVQLIGGEGSPQVEGDPLELLETFALTGEVAVVDLDAALGRGDNRELIAEMCKRARCRVGGGLRSTEACLDALDAGATKVVIGTAAEPAFLQALPRDRVVCALDARHNEVVVDGWRTKTGRSLRDRINELRDFADSFLVTFVEKEGRMAGTRLDEAAALREIAGSAELTVAGGVTTAADIAELDRLGIAAQVGMALYTGRLDLGVAFAAPMRSDRSDGLWPTVVVDEEGVALGLTYSDLESLSQAISTRRGVYHSRKRGLWTKGESSGATQELIAIDVDCDRDTLRFTVRQKGPGFCHAPARTCWGEDRGWTQLLRRLKERSVEAPPESYTARLLRDGALLEEKLLEEARELAEARTPAEVAHEAADVLYFTGVALARSGVDLSAVSRELDQRSRRVRRRSAVEERGSR